MSNACDSWWEWMSACRREVADRQTGRGEVVIILSLTQFSHKVAYNLQHIAIIVSHTSQHI